MFPFLIRKKPYVLIPAEIFTVPTMIFQRIVLQNILLKIFCDFLRAAVIQVYPVTDVF
jgi:hypothetical protein